MNLFKRKEEYNFISFDDELRKIREGKLIKTKKGLYDKKDKVYIPYPKISFKNYRQALKFLKNYINQKTILSNYDPSDIEIALITLFKSKKFMELIK